MLKKSKSYHSKYFTATLSDDPSGIWYVDVSCRTEKDGVPGRVVGHIPLCLALEENEKGEVEAVLSLMDEEEDEDDGLQFPGSLQFPGRK